MLSTFPQKSRVSHGIFLQRNRCFLFGWFCRKHENLTWLEIHESAKKPTFAALLFQEANTQHNEPQRTKSRKTFAGMSAMSKMILRRCLLFLKGYLILLRVLVFGLHTYGQKSVFKVQTFVRCHMYTESPTQVLCKLRVFLTAKPSLQ